VRARWATTGVFFANGAIIGSWVAQIPWVQARFGLSKAVMGLVLMAMSLSVIAVLPVAGQAVARHGSVVVTRRAGLAAALAVNLPVLAPHAALVALGLVVLGGCNASMDVAMNSHGVKVEHDLGRPIMSSLHAGWSFGGMAGAGFAAVTAAVGVDPRITVAVASVLLLVAVVVSTARVGAGSTGAGEDTPRFTRPERAVVLLAVLCFLTMLTEGAMGDWGGVYLHQSLHAAEALAAGAFAAFTAGMTVGRVFGDRVNDRIGSVALLRTGALVAGLPLAAMLLIGAPWAAMAGLFAVGLGVANGVPLMFSAAGRRGGVAAGPSIAAVSSMGSLGFLAGPPFIGLIGQAVSLPWALALLVAAAAAVFVLARRAVGSEVVEVA
jgi:MFS transporter